MTKLLKNKFYLLIFSVVFLCGCNNIDDPKRISGIIDAVYTNYEYEKDFDKSTNYLLKKVYNKEISESTSYVIKQCLHRSFKNK